MQAVELLSY